MFTELPCYLSAISVGCAVNSTSFARDWKFLYVFCLLQTGKLSLGLSTADGSIYRLVSSSLRQVYL